MSIYQKICIAFGIFLIILSMLFPVWSVYYGGVEMGTLRCFIYSKGIICLAKYVKKHPGLKEVPYNTKVTIDYGRMSVEVTLIILLTVGAVVLLRPRKQRTC